MLRIIIFAVWSGNERSYHDIVGHELHGALHGIVMIWWNRHIRGSTLGTDLLWRGTLYLRGPKLSNPNKRSNGMIMIMAMTMMMMMIMMMIMMMVMMMMMMMMMMMVMMMVMMMMMMMVVMVMMKMVMRKRSRSGWWLWRRRCCIFVVGTPPNMDDKSPESAKNSAIVTT